MLKNDFQKLMPGSMAEVFGQVMEFDRYTGDGYKFFDENQESVVVPEDEYIKLLFPVVVFDSRINEMLILHGE